MDKRFTKTIEMPDSTLNLKSPSQLNLEYRLLDAMDEELILDAAECLSETLVETDSCRGKISEPMVNALGLSKRDMFEFALKCIRDLVVHELSFVALDKKTNRVVAVVVSENFDPEKKNFSFKGSLAPMNDIVDFLAEIDNRFLNTVQFKTGCMAEKNEYVQVFMCGSRLAKFRGYVIAKLIKLIMDRARKNGYKGIFAKTTTSGYAKIFTEYHNFHLVYDKENKPILKTFSSVEALKKIPPEISEDCRIFYRALGNDRTLL
ncbi:hypothetical protein R9X47_05715 [Wukongibacter baidiensis]|uniref:hypothetical protein n=1 Tax=Wukongibacter baidiensis TaxID=1723361 RepID=UPI003D7F1D16